LRHFVADDGTRGRLRGIGATAVATLFHQPLEKLLLVLARQPRQAGIGYGHEINFCPEIVAFRSASSRIRIAFSAATGSAWRAAIVAIMSSSVPAAGVPLSR